MMKQKLFKSFNNEYYQPETRNPLREHLINGWHVVSSVTVGTEYVEYLIEKYEEEN